MLLNNSREQFSAVDESTIVIIRLHGNLHIKTTHIST